MLPHLQHAAALVAHTVSTTVPRKPGSPGPKFSDFLPRTVGSADEPITLEEAMRTW
ncbi:hypothetical protein P609_19690 [Comamonas thiooxydans]|nr:hypothetical protein P609_19690 [Comamonas thiooxydans]